MTFKWRRRRDHVGGELQGDAGAVSESLERAAKLYGSDSRDFDLAVAIGDLLGRSPTADIEALVRAGMDEEQFYERELRPNWEGLSKSERAAKVQSFTRFANSLGHEDAGGMGAIVRTKVLVLAWAYDRTYGEGLLKQIAREPELFGRLELSASH
jgi:hypothetical protein